jgi:hypothetical protein
MHGNGSNHPVGALGGRTKAGGERRTAAPGRAFRGKVRVPGVTGRTEHLWLGPGVDRELGRVRLPEHDEARAFQAGHVVVVEIGYLVANARDPLAVRTPRGEQDVLDRDGHAVERR